jgi:uncharacterized protein YecE (DUF72 family)
MELSATGALGEIAQVGDAGLLVGACSWADSELVKESSWYPRRSMPAAARLAYYASQFPIVEITNTHWFPPTPEQTASWVERTPAGFTFDVRAWSLLTGHPTFPQSLWPDLQDAVLPELRDRRRLYPSHLTSGALDECWDRFVHALRPMADAGRLGVVTLRWPEWVSPKPEHRDAVRDAAARLQPYAVAVEWRNPRWLEPDECDVTLELLEEIGASFVCVDEAHDETGGVPPVVATTADIAVVRFHGRGRPDPAWRGPQDWARHRHRYRPEELEPWVGAVDALATSARQVHVLFANAWRDAAVSSAAMFRSLVTGRDAQ